MNMDLIAIAESILAQQETSQNEVWPPLVQPDSCLDAFLEGYDRIIIFFSGGKDSLACLLIVVSLFNHYSLWGKVELELWHHEVDGREGSKLMDWPCTPAYCRAIADAFGIPLYFSWLEGGFEREMLRDNQPKARTWFETPQGLQVAGGNSGKLGTRLKFPQVSADLSVRWCSAYLKIDVASIGIKNQERFNTGRTLTISGERAEESPARAKYALFEPDRTDNGSRHVDRWRPVLYYKEAAIWRLIEFFRVNPHPAYRIGFGRVSCMTCIFGSDNQWATVDAIAPQHLKPVVGYEQRFGVTIHRKLSISDRVERGTPYSGMQSGDIQAAMSESFDEPIILPYGQACICEQIRDRPPTGEQQQLVSLLLCGCAVLDICES